MELWSLKNCPIAMNFGFIPPHLYRNRLTMERFKQEPQENGGKVIIDAKRVLLLYNWLEKWSCGR